MEQAGKTAQTTFDYVVIGSGFGGSVSALRLTEKGYSVLVMERGKRFRDADFPRTNWNLRKYLWLPALRCFGILQISLFRNVLVLHGSGVGGGSLGYSAVLMKPDDRLFSAPAWSRLADWKKILEPHYATACRMLGVAPNPELGPSDDLVRQISGELGRENTFSPTEGGIYFGPVDEMTPDPYFGGDGPPRKGCTFCGGCMVGCRDNAKNTLDKNYLYLAEKWGAKVWAEREVRDVRPLPEGQPDGARYEVVYRSSTALLFKPERVVRARNVIFSASALGTMRLLFRCKESTGSLPNLSEQLGEMVRTNSEALLGASARKNDVDYSKGVAITSIIHPDSVTWVEPVRYPAGSSSMRLLSGPLIDVEGENLLKRFWFLLAHILRQPLDTLRMYILPGWAERTVILLVMQTEDNFMRILPGRSSFTFFRRGLVSQPYADERTLCRGKIEIGHRISRRLAEKINGFPAGTMNEALLNIPMTAHIMGGCPIGLDDQTGVVGLDFQVHNYPGLYVVDGSIMPANPGVNPSLTITALAEYAMSQIAPKPDGKIRKPVGVVN